LADGRIFKATGEPDADSDFLVPDPGSAGSKYDPAATTLADGRLVVVWTNGDAAGNPPYSIKAQLFNADGSKSDVAFVVDQGEPVAGYSKVVALKDGGFAISYLDGADQSIHVVFYSSEGTFTADVVLPAQAESNAGVDTSLTVLPDGRVLVSWDEEIYVEAEESSQKDVFAAIIDPRDHAVTLAGTDADDWSYGTGFNDV
jgi:hypothetical protein